MLPGRFLFLIPVLCQAFSDAIIYQEISMQTITLEAFVAQGRTLVLTALDAHVREILRHPDARGWTDQELTGLLPAIDAHLETVALRIATPGNREPGATNLKIEGVQV